MIYLGDTGVAVRIVANVGKVSSDELNQINGRTEYVIPLNLCRVSVIADQKIPEGRMFWRFVQFLKADQGWQEIDEAMQKVAILTLSDEDRLNAIRYAI